MRAGVCSCARWGRREGSEGQGKDLAPVRGRERRPGWEGLHFPQSSGGLADAKQTGQLPSRRVQRARGILWG